MLKNMNGINSVAVIDFETTGLSPEKDYPIEGAILKVDLNSGETNEYSSKTKLPDDVVLSKFITDYISLTTEDVNEEGKYYLGIKSALQSLIDDETLVIAHNANFDLGFMSHHFAIHSSNLMCTRTIEFLTNPH